MTDSFAVKSHGSQLFSWNHQVAGILWTGKFMRCFRKSKYVGFIDEACPRGTSVPVPPYSIQSNHYQCTATTASSSIQFPSPSVSKQLPNDCSSRLRLKVGAPRLNYLRSRGTVDSSVFTNHEKPRTPWNKTGRSQCVSLNRLAKRKTINETEDQSPARKIHVNEARMAARMQELHLDNNNLEWHPNLEEEPWYARVPLSGAQMISNNSIERTDSQEMESDSEEIENDNSSSTSSLPKLELSEELKLGLKNKDVVNKLIMDEINKPLMQVVLWKPPGDFVKDILPDKLSEQETEGVLPVDTKANQSGADMETNTDMPNMSQFGMLQPLPLASPPPVISCLPLFDSVDDEMEL